MNPFKSLLRLLKDTTVSKIELTATPPFVKLVFDKEELLGLFRGQALVSDAISKHFVRRRVFWEGIPEQNREYVLESLEEAEAGLDGLSLMLSEGTEPSAVGLTKFLRSWASTCALARKSLKKRLDEIENEEKNHTLDHDSAEKNRTKAYRDALVALRRTVYPLVTALVGFLPDNDPTKQAAQKKLDEGLGVVPGVSLKRESIPDWDEAS
jgi:hypothetical protein